MGQENCLKGLLCNRKDQERKGIGGEEDIVKLGYQSAVHKVMKLRYVYILYTGQSTLSSYWSVPQETM